LNFKLNSEALFFGMTLAASHPCYFAIENRVVPVMYPGTKPCSSARLCMGNVKTTGGRRPRSLERKASQ
jgi:hypothetical protein